MEEALDMFSFLDLSKPVGHSLTTSDTQKITSAVIVRWLTDHEQKQRFAQINAKIDRLKNRHTSSDFLGVFKSMMSVFNSSADEAETLKSFWDDDTLNNQVMDVVGSNASVSFSMLKATLKLQIVVRLWIAKKNFYAKIAKFASDAAKNDGDQLLTTLKVYHARAQARLLEINKAEVDEHFGEFCTKLIRTEANPGFPVKMFGRKYGNLSRRNLYFSDDFNYIQYQPGRWTTSSVELKSLYEVNKGLSTFVYQNAKVTHNAWCFHLKSLQGRVYDFEALSASQSKTLYNGFKRLIRLLYGDSSFYIDKNGVPRRAGASIIKNCIARSKNNSHHAGGGGTQAEKVREKSTSLHMSFADTERYRYAIRMLKVEYESWDVERRKELDAWEKFEEARILEEKVQLLAVKGIKNVGNKDVAATPATSSNTAEKEVSAENVPEIKSSSSLVGIFPSTSKAESGKDNVKEDDDDNEANDDDAGDEDVSDDDAGDEDVSDDDAGDDDAGDDDTGDEDDTASSDEEEQEEGDDDDDEEEEEEEEDEN